jgi:hypothetical protein
MLVGLADGFVDYVTTEEEYNEQGYEGAATLYGPKSGEFFLQRYTALATPSSTPDHLDSSISYDPGPRKSFGLHTSYASEAVLQDGIAHLLVNASSGAPLIEPPRFKWWAPPLLWPPAPNTPVAWPSIEIEQESSPNVWTPVQDPFPTGSTLLLLRDYRSDRAQFEAIALDPPLNTSFSWRFRLLSSDGPVVSPSFAAPTRP